jgi:hypothetical protein
VRGGGFRDALRGPVERVLKNLRNEWISAARVKQKMGSSPTPYALRLHNEENPKRKEKLS